MFKRVLIANRGEIAIRIARTAASLGIETIAVYADVDASSLHTQFVTKAIPLEQETSKGAVEAYLNGSALVELARANGCDCIHPGYGFLSENAQFASRCAEAGVKFIGPSAATLGTFGDKVEARALAESVGVPIVPGSTTALDTADEAHRVASEIGYPIMLKAAAGGGGRGMQSVYSEQELGEVFTRCSSEAEAAFANGSLFVEKLIHRPRHIEVQILGDVGGKVVHLYERDCSIQQRNQKVIEIAPAPELDQAIRTQLHEHAITLCKASNYENAGTVEFLLEPESGSFYFIECNPRIQVEHTVTEQVMSLDLIDIQFQLAAGKSLADLGLSDQQEVPTPRGFSVQARVVARGTGKVSAYKEPSGPGIRVDACAYAGYEVRSEFDPLIAKVVATTTGFSGFRRTVVKVLHALDEYHLEGLATNIEELQAILAHEDVQGARARTTFLTENPELLNSNGSSQSSIVDFLAKSAGSNRAGLGMDSPSIQPALEQVLKPKMDELAVKCPTQSTVVEVAVQRGDLVQIGQTLLVVSAMKMETHISSPVEGEVVALLELADGAPVLAETVVALVRPLAQDATVEQTTTLDNDTWQPLLDQVDALKELAQERLALDSEEPGVVRQRSRGKLTCRERIDLLLDEATFHEVGSVAGFASYDEEGNVTAFTPANHVGGWGAIDQRTVIVCADDFTSRGGHADGAIGAKSSHLDRLSVEMRTPSIRMLDGSSGGGSVAAMVPQQRKEGDSTAKESSGAIKAGRPRVAGGGGSYLPGHLGSAMYTEQLATVPVVNMLLGSVVGIGAAKAVLGHFSVMVKDIAQLFVAGPPVVSHAMGYDITKEDLGDWRIHCTNGSVDNLAESEEEAARMVRAFLSYLPQNVFEVPPRQLGADDPRDRREEELFHLVPRKRTTTFDVRRAISLMTDQGSFFEIGRLWGTDQVTGFVRFNGYPVGVIASDSQHVNGGALTADGCSKLTRHLDLCDLFHIPILNLVDNPGFAVGLEHERAGTIRRGGEWMVAFSQVKVPIFTVVMRRSFGVAGNNYASPRSTPSLRVAWPAADVGGIPPEGGIEAAYKRQLAEAKDPIALRAELNARIESARGPMGPLSKFQIEEMIDPRDTRRYVCEWVEQAYRVLSQPDRLGSRALQFRP